MMSYEGSSITIAPSVLYRTGKKYPDFAPQRIPVVDQSNVAEYVEKWKNANTVEGAFKASAIRP